MLPTAVQTLLDSVRRRLWRDGFVRAVRRALWASALALLLFVALHLALWPVPAMLVWGSLGLLWAALLVLAATQRPSAAASALWADRHLGGASAFSTLFEAAGGAAAAHGTSQAPARAWLVQWAAAQVPACAQRLAAWPASLRLARPLASAGVCAALAFFVLSLPGRAPPAAAPVVAQALPASADRPTAEAAVRAAMVNTVASALRAAGPREPAASRGTEGAGGAAAAGADPGATPPAAASAAPATPTGLGAAAQDGRRGTTVDAAPPRPAGAPQQSAGGAGREAGASADWRADVGVSRPLQARSPVPTSAVDARPDGSIRQADLGRLGRYQDDTSNAGARAELPTPAAATPPPAANATRLTPTQTTYVQAWLKASPRPR